MNSTQSCPGPRHTASASVMRLAASPRLSTSSFRTWCGESVAATVRSDGAAHRRYHAPFKQLRLEPRISREIRRQPEGDTASRLPKLCVVGLGSLNKTPVPYKPTMSTRGAAHDTAPNRQRVRKWHADPMSREESRSTCSGLDAEASTSRKNDGGWCLRRYRRTAS